ncbi:MAG TPA: hypothetical protein VM165_20580 [Planctomycetaceae bacterium]|nr:hypothetical protein [Planctomycetaceae bacterium]
MRDCDRPQWLTVRLMMTAGVVWAGMLDVADAEPAADEAARRSAAVALNYSRASLHRIRRNPSLRVLAEEQEKILNHLNLNGIADEDVMKLYTAVLDEIAQIQLADREREMLRGKYRMQMQQSISFNALALSAQVLTAQYSTAVKTGASSWWDYRNFSTNRDLDLHKVDKERMTKLVEKSARFLDVSWKTARDRQIPDRWLVRGDDLDKLEAAWTEPDPAVRLRVMKRMEPFLECYPPYWYYTARTQQALGQMVAANETYGKMAAIGDGHFRKDDMLAAGLANRALIQAFLEQPTAPATARLALNYSTEVWEANLLCASVLQRHREYTDAEDAILRNLDVDQEGPQSRVALVSLYHSSDDRTKLARRLSDPQFVRDLPVSLLVQSAAKLGESQTPPLVAQMLERSLQATARYNLGRDDVVIQAGAGWRLQQAQLTLYWNDKPVSAPKLTAGSESIIATFEGVGELSASGTPRELSLVIQYADAAPLKVLLQPSGASPPEGGSSLFIAQRRQPTYRVAGIEQDDTRLSLHAGVARAVAKSSPAIARQATGHDLTQTQPVGTTTFKPVIDDDPYFITPPIEVPFD